MQPERTKKMEHELDDVSNNRLNERTSQELNFRLITTAKNNLSEIHIISANALRFPLCPIMALDMYKDILNTKIYWIGLAGRNGAFSRFVQKQGNNNANISKKCENMT